MPLAAFCLELSPTAYAVFRDRVLHKAVSHEITRFSHRERERKKEKLSGNFMVNFGGKNFVSIAREEAYFSEVTFSDRLVYKLMY